MFQEKRKHPKVEVGQGAGARPSTGKQANIVVSKKACKVTSATDVSHQQVPVEPGTTASTTSTAVEPVRPQLVL